MSGSDWRDFDVDAHIQKNHLPAVRTNRPHVTQKDIDIALKKRPKYGAIPHWVDERLIPLAENPGKPSAIRFDSKHEAEYFVQLRQRLERGEITNLALQVAFPICVTNPSGVIVNVARWIADFVWLEASGVTAGMQVVCDAKGVRTEAYKLKKRLVEAQHGLSILEV